jgi:hypothetical protein
VGPRATISTLQTGYPYIQAPSQDKLQGMHPHTATCHTALDLASQLRWAPALPRVLWLRTSPPGLAGLRRCHVSYGSKPHLPTGAGFGTATRPMAPCGPWVSSARFQDASRQGHHAPVRRADRQCSQYLQGVQTDIYSAATMRRQYSGPLAWHRYSVK